MGAKTKDPSPDLWDARDDRLTAVDFSEPSAVGRQSILCLLSHTTATISVKSSLSQHGRNMNCGKWRTRATAPSNLYSTSVALCTAFRLCGWIPQAYRLQQAQELRASITDSSMLAPATVAIVACEQPQYAWP